MNDAEEQAYERAVAIGGALRLPLAIAFVVTIFVCGLLEECQ